jgi:acyl-CoA dehydrogenase
MATNKKSGTGGPGHNGRSQPASPPAGLTAVDLGRASLADWEAAQPDNFFTADRSLQRSLEYLWGQETYRRHARRLMDFGRVAATEIDPLARLVNRDEHLPRLERFNGRGDRVEDVIFHPDHHQIGRLLYGSGLMSVYEQPGHNLLAMALFYLSSQNGEAGHNCPVACTAGLIKIMQNVASAALRDQYLPGLLNPDYDTHYNGAQFLTEVQGGSDVGANAMVAGPLETAEGTWLLNGEKWFCSNVTGPSGPGYGPGS